MGFQTLLEINADEMVAKYISRFDNGLDLEATHPIATPSLV